ncbi:DNA gyrase subunit A [Litorivicinus lipolyticus]|uniref:DNA gyrase subunit A n=1 Tax=Litorivicinus lipolyticus TaxID=418701 RepID=A0A5Q2QA10_9GAMM|nr:DNA gyrase subunit A [Litorivicinus lipolyticus]QGG80053.1 DNA gyrase subunit A [Litorivicinus lipolyticus]
MSTDSREIQPINIEDELKQSYLDYAMSVIVGRALPDARDGLKPVHRRVLFAMDVLSNDWNRAYKKSARIVGDVIGKYHPHGDTAVYDTIVRMAQDFSLRYPLVDGQGNFGSIDGDRAAAMRYTEIRMRRIAHEMLGDLDKDTVDYVPNYDGTEKIPDVLPTRIPNLLVNGSAGIAVGMATNIPPHNLREILDACFVLLDKPEADVEELMEHVRAPDFPTGGFVNGLAGVRDAYRTGRGKCYIRAKHIIEEKDNGKVAIVFTEMPYQVNKAKLTEKIAELVKEKRIEGISELRDESDKDGIRLVVELRRGEPWEVILNQLFKDTALETSFGINMVALVGNQPRILNLKDLLEEFLTHRREVVTRRSIFELKEARRKGHVLEGQAVALANIDPIIELIKSSTNSGEAKDKLVARGWAPGNVMAMLERAGEGGVKPEDLPDGYGLVGTDYHMSPAQAQAILDLRLHRLTGLEQDKIMEDYNEILEIIIKLKLILGDAAELKRVIREEFEDIRARYGDDRRSVIIENRLSLTTEDLIAPEEMVVTLSRDGWAKCQPISAYRAQRRGGKGKIATGLKEEDVVEHLLIANTHDTVLMFTDKGRLFWLKVYEIPQASRIARGRPLINMLEGLGDEKVTAILPLAKDEAGEDRNVCMATASGVIKKVPLVAFARPRAAGIIAIGLDEGDRLISVALTDGRQTIMLMTSSGKALRFEESLVRSMGRQARGVTGIKFRDPSAESVISMIIPGEGTSVLLASEHGFGKRVAIDEFPLKGRAGLGVIAINCSDRNGQLVGAVQVAPEDDVILISNRGTMVRTPVEQISELGRAAQGVTLLKVAKGEQLVSVAGVPDTGEDDGVEDMDAVEAAVELDRESSEPGQGDDADV